MEIRALSTCRRRPAVLAALIMGLITVPATAQVPITADGMMQTVRHLTDVQFKGRGIGSPELDHAAAYIAERFATFGLQPGGAPSGSWFQEWTDPETKIRMRNVVGVLPGRNPLHAGQSVVIGAHYDHLGTGPGGVLKANQGKMHPGADDNASGVAVLLELASRLPLVMNLERSIVFVAFTGEEAGRKGSKYYVQNEKHYPAAKVSGMINLDTVGRLGKNKVMIIGGGSAKEWADVFTEAGRSAEVGILMASQDLDSSDQRSFHEVGVPAVQVFTGPHIDYHRPTDSADKVDGPGLVKVATVARSAAMLLANAPAALTSGIDRSAGQEPAQRTERKTTMGIVPDFTFNGTGARLGGTMPGGPAEQAGLKDGDIVVRFDTIPVNGVRDLSDAIRTRRAGDKVAVRFLRDGSEFQATVILRER